MALYARLDYTSRDYSAVLAELQALIQVQFPDWTDFDPGNPGSAMLEALAWVADLLFYYQDRQVNEAFLITAVERQNIINHLRGIGYELETASASSTDLTVSLSAPLSEDWTWPATTQVTTDDQQTSGETQSDLTFLAGEVGPKTVTWVEGETWTEALGESDGTASQEFKLGRTPFLGKSDSFFVDGIAWTRVANFLNSGPNDQHYVVQVDANDFGTIITGDGINGAVPTQGATCQAIYRTGGGDHNVDVGMLTRLPVQPVTLSGKNVPLVVTNAEKATGGAPRESEDHAKLFGPASIKTNSRSVAKEDYELNAMAVPGVSRAIALTANEAASIPENSVYVFIVPEGGGTPSDALRAAVLTQLQETTPKAITTRVQVMSALYGTINPAGTAYVTSSTSSSQQTKLLLAAANAVLAAYQNFFDPDAVDTENGGWLMNFGQMIDLSKLYSLARDVQNVRRVNLTAPVADVAMTYAWQFPELASASVVQVNAALVQIQFAGSPGTNLSFVPVS